MRFRMHTRRRQSASESSIHRHTHPTPHLLPRPHPAASARSRQYSPASSAGNLPHRLPSSSAAASNNARAASAPLANAGSLPSSAASDLFVARDNRVHSRLKVRNCRLRVLERPHLLGKLRPAHKPMLARQKELCICQQRRRPLRLPQLHCQRISTCLPSASVGGAGAIPHGHLLGSLQPSHRPGTHGIIRRYVRRRAKQFPGEFLVVVETGTRRQRNRVRHTNLLSRMPGVRTHQAERKFAIWFSTSVGGHGPFRGLDAPLALPTLYHELQCPRGSLVLGVNLRLKCHRLDREERMAAACDRVIVLYQSAPRL